MSISILNRGASGGLTASIIVNGLSEADTVTASNGSKTKSGVWNTTENRHEINGITDIGVWTVIATNGEETKTQDVLIEVIGLYEIEMDYKLWLYREGDEFTDVTGGWVSVRSQSGSSYPMGTATKNADNLYCSAKAQSAGWTFHNTITVTEYNTLKAVVTTPANFLGCMNLYTGTAYSDNSIARIDNFVSRTEEEISLNISGVTGEYKVHLGCWYPNTSMTQTLTIHKVWLE